MEDRAESAKDERVQSFAIADEHPPRTRSAGDPEPQEGGRGPRPSSMLLSKRAPKTFTVQEAFRIGEGTFARVYGDSTGEYALKHVDEKPWYLLECCVMQTLRECPFVVPLVGTNARRQILVMPLARSTAFEYSLSVDYMGSRAPTTELIRAWSWQLLRSLEETHGRGVMHRDVKPQNVLIGRDSSLLLADWNSATFSTSDVAKISRQQALSNNFDPDVCTIITRAPETLGNKARPHGMCSDIWSAAITLCQIFGRRSRRSYAWTDFGDICPDSEAVTIAKMTSALGRIPEFGWDDVPNLRDAHDLTFEERRRVVQRTLLQPTADSLFLNLITQLLDMDHRRRPTASEALQHPFFRGCTDEWSRATARAELSMTDSDLTMSILRKARLVEVVSAEAPTPWARPPSLGGTDLEYRRQMIMVNIGDERERDLLLRAMTHILPGKVEKGACPQMCEGEEGWEVVLAVFEALRWSLPPEVTGCQLLRD